MKHPKYDLILAAISGEQMQFLHSNGWVDCCAANDAIRYIINGVYNVRIKPKTITINGIEVPAPVTEPLEDGQKYWVWHTYEGEFYEHIWGDDEHDRRWLKNRLIHLTEAAARENREAVIKALGGEV